jgi:hypothetical protein
VELLRKEKRKVTAAPVLGAQSWYQDTLVIARLRAFVFTSKSSC